MDITLDGPFGLADYIGQTGQSFAKRWKDHMISTMGSTARLIPILLGVVNGA